MTKCLWMNNIKGERYNMRRSSRSKGLRAVFVGVFLFFFVGILTHHATKRMTTFKHWKLSGRDHSHALHWAPNLIYVSKRRVPNGPDPIHNRRAVKTREPPGRA